MIIVCGILDQGIRTIPQSRSVLPLYWNCLSEWQWSGKGWREGITLLEQAAIGGDVDARHNLLLSRRTQAT